ncbi:MAG: efflux RND transporter permease subunit [Planctomycetota bacterium]
MDPIRFAISKPVGVTVGVLLVVLFGLIGLGAIPVQLTPNVDQPTVNVRTTWDGRSPDEIVDQVTKEQEERLKSIDGLRTMTSITRQGSSEITLDFDVGVDVARALADVDDALRQVPEYPADVDEPTREAVDSSSGPSNAIAWFIVDIPPEIAARHPDFDIATLFFQLDKEVKPYLERTDGVAEINVFGGRDREVRVLVDPVRLTQLNVTYGELIDALEEENINVSAGSIDESKREYPVRVLGQFESIERVENVIVAYPEAGPVRVRDIATVEMGFEKKRGFVRSQGHDAIAINAIRQSGSNVVDIMDEIKERLATIQKDILPTLHPELGEHLRMRQVYDQTIYIDSAISLVTQNLWVGGIIAAFVLVLFLRSLIATGVIALAIPISVIGTFLVLLGLGRSLNVISLAGLAFAVGMVVDNAIVVLENIYRHRQMGKAPTRAAYEGAKEVWGAILASTLTTIAVFVPILTIQDEAGQLFRDISLAIVASVSLSLIVSITVIPAACARVLPQVKEHKNVVRHLFDSAFGLAPLFRGLSVWLAAVLRWSMGSWRGLTIRPLIIAGLTAASLMGATALIPPLDYLPAGNRNLVFGFMLIPPGLSVSEKANAAEVIDKWVKPYQLAAEDPNTWDSLGDISRGPETDENGMPIVDPQTGEMQMIPSFPGTPVEHYFVGAVPTRTTGMFAGATSANEDVVLPLAQLINNAISDVPDTFGGASQSSLFGRGIEGGNSVDVEVMGIDYDRVKAAAEALFFSLANDQRYGFQRVRPDPGNFNLAQQEWQVEVNDAGAELGLRTSDVGRVIRSLFDGEFVGEFYEGANAIDVVVVPEGGRLDFVERLAEIPIRTPAGAIVSIDTVVDIVPGLAPQEIKRIEEFPAVTISVTPPQGKAVEEVIADVRERHVGLLRQAGVIDDTLRIRYQGTAEDLARIRGALLGDFQQSGLTVPALIGVGIVALFGVGLAGSVAVRGRGGPLRVTYGILGALALGALLVGLTMLILLQPQLVLARMVWALLVTYLLMAALFESFTYPLVIMFTVPLAIVGGFAGLAIVHHWTVTNPLIQPQLLDVLTMLGFVILIGVVVNNAILIVHQSLNLMRGSSEVPEGTPAHDLNPDGTMRPEAAIAEAVRSRVRPVFMSTMTSVGGMLPLVLFPGAGSELYRGLGSVVVGGLLVSTIFTLVLVPMLLSLMLDMAAGLKTAFAAQPASSASGPGSDQTGGHAPATVPAPARPAPTLEPAGV